VEVTLRSTARIDRGEKVAEYCKAASLRGYLIVDQNLRRVTYYTRDVDGAWAHAELTGSGTIAIPCPKTALTLDQIYEDVSMPPLGVAEPDVDEATGEYVMAED
jgi:Uma2 family endonuclease